METMEKSPVERRYRVGQGVLGEGGFVAYMFAASKKHAVEKFKVKYGERVDETKPIDVNLLT